LTAVAVSPLTTVIDTPEIARRGGLGVAWAWRRCAWEARRRAA